MRSSLTAAGIMGLMALPVATATETTPAYEATTTPTATATPTPTPSETAPGSPSPSPEQPTPSPAPTDPPSESIQPTPPTPAPTPEPEPTEVPSPAPEPPQPNPQPTGEVAPTPVAPQPSDGAAPLSPTLQHTVPQHSTEEVQGTESAFTPWTLDSNNKGNRIAGVITPPLDPVDPRTTAAVASGRLPASVLGLANPQNIERQSYDGTSGWVEGFLNSGSAVSPRSDSSTAAGVVGAEAREGGVSAMPSGNAFERGIAIVSGSGPLVIFTGIAACGLLLIVGNFMRQSHTDKR